MEYDKIISVCYGTVNPCYFALLEKNGAKWSFTKELYWDSRITGYQITDGEYANFLPLLSTDKESTIVLIEPCAASFIETVKRKGWTVSTSNKTVKNNVFDSFLMNVEAALGNVDIYSRCAFGEPLENEGNKSVFTAFNMFAHYLKFKSFDEIQRRFDKIRKQIDTFDNRYSNLKYEAEELEFCLRKYREMLSN